MVQQFRTAVCEICDGAGLRVIVREDGERFAQVCVCRLEERTARLIARARIPRRYENCALDNYETGFHGADPTLRLAHMTAKKFVEGYPVEMDGGGLLITGDIGVGKTHLAVGVLRALVVEKNARALFYDYRELLKEIQNSYNPQVAATELDVLRPVLEAEVLVLDELGAQKPTDWVWDTVAHILNSRYNDRRTTIITANYVNQPPAGADVTNRLGGEEARAAARASRQDSLGDRIGERMRSRLQEMCVSIEITGKDMRQGVKRATLL